MTIQAEYQRMRLQQDMRQVRTKHKEQLSAATLRADLAQTTLESTQLQLEIARKQTFHNAATTLQIGVCRSQAQHDMRELLGAHRAQMQQQDQKMEQLRSEMAQAEATHREEKDKLHAMKEDALTKLRDSNEAEVARLQSWAAQDRFVYKHRWRKNDVVIWDNSSVMHRRESFPPEQRRFMKRTGFHLPKERGVPF